MFFGLLKYQSNFKTIQMFHLLSGCYLVRGICRSHCVAGEKGESFSSNKISAPTLSHWHALLFWSGKVSLILQVKFEVKIVTVVCLNKFFVYCSNLRVLTGSKNLSWKNFPTKFVIYGEITPISKIDVRGGFSFGVHCSRATDQFISGIIL